MHYFIDGYNFMFRILRAGDDLQTQREAIIRDLNRKIRILNLDVTIVFDAHYQSSEGVRTHFQHLEICFSAKGESADDFILHQIKQEKHPRQLTVVTSDKKLAWLSRRQGCLTETIEEFLKWLNSRYVNKIKRREKILIPQDIPAPKKAEPPVTTPSSPEEYFDFYLRQFEKNFQQIVKTQPPKNSKKTPKMKKNSKIKKTKEGEHLSNMERWIKAFERNVEENE